jgi:hypothetical protein
MYFSDCSVGQVVEFPILVLIGFKCHKPSGVNHHDVTEFASPASSDGHLPK